MLNNKFVTLEPMTSTTQWHLLGSKLKMFPFPCKRFVPDLPSGFSLLLSEIIIKREVSDEYTIVFETITDFLWAHSAR